MSASRVPCVFETRYGTESGSRLALLGDVPELGAWYPSDALFARDEGGKKTVKVELPVGSTAFFKWTVIDLDGNIVQWEETPNKQLIVPECERMRVVAPWNQSPTIKFVTSSKSHVGTPEVNPSGEEANLQTLAVEQEPKTPSVAPKPQAPPVPPKPKKLPVEPKPQTPAVEYEPKTSSVAPKPQAPPVAPKPQTPPVEPKPQTPAVEPKTQTPPVEPKPQTWAVEPKPQTTAVEPKTQTPPVEPKLHTTSPPMTTSTENHNGPQSPLPEVNQASGEPEIQKTITPKQVKRAPRLWTWLVPVGVTAVIFTGAAVAMVYR